MYKRVAVLLFGCFFSLAVLAACSSSKNTSLNTEKIVFDEARNSATKASKVEALFTDPRDGQTYKTVQIGSQTWMAENLNDGKGYTWDEAMMPNVCPTGWHLPTYTEWRELVLAVGGFSVASRNLGVAGTKTRVNSNCTLCDVTTVEYKDDYKFSALLNAQYWTSTEDDIYRAYYLNLSSDSDAAALDYDLKRNRFSVRCVKGEYPKAVIPKKVEATFTDSRDGQTYKTVKIGPQTWFAQNLNYETYSSYCYDNNDLSCSHFGRLYSLADAVEACPAGWHLPTQDDWNVLFEAVGGRSVAGKKLKLTTGWENCGFLGQCHDNNGSDDFGFAVNPVGRDSTATFWSSSEKFYDKTFVVVDSYQNEMGVSIVFSDDTAHRRNDYMNKGHSVRCVKD